MLRTTPSTLADKDNEGHGGYSIAKIQAGIVGWLNQFNPNVVLLMLGSNNDGYTTPAISDAAR